MNQPVARRALRMELSISNDVGPNASELYDLAAALLPIGAWSCDLASDRLSWTDGVFDMFGLSKERAPDRRATIEMYSEESREQLERKRSRAIETGAGFTLDASITRADGIERWIRITAATRAAHGRIRTLYGMKQDITEERARWEALRAQAECDPLTGVANRSRFQHFLDRPNGGPGNAHTGALILFDMDDFKLVNDCWGHAAGDACLIAFARRLREAFGEAHLVSRIGGDEFAVLLPLSGSRSETESAVHALIGDLLAPVVWQGHLLPLSVSVGLAFDAEAHGRDPHKLFIAADEALYSAKERKNGSSVFVGP